MNEHTVWFVNPWTKIMLHFTLIGFISCMHIHVSTKLMWLSEAFVTNFALVWFITHVSAHVSSKFIWLSKTFYHKLSTSKISSQYEFADHLQRHLPSKITHHTLCNDKVYLLYEYALHVSSKIWLSEASVTNFTLVTEYEYACAVQDGLCGRKAYHKVLHMYGLSPEWTRMWTLNVLNPTKMLIPLLCLVRFNASMNAHMPF